MKRGFTIIVCLFAAYLAAGQDHPWFSTQNMVGIQIGGSGQRPQVQTWNGLAWKNWFGGLGTGIDWYYRRSIPLFFTGARFIPLTPRRQLLLSGGAGINFPWDKSPGDYWIGWNSTHSTYKPGMYWNTGVGYRLQVGKQKDMLLFHMGYNVKEHTEDRYTEVACLIPPCPGQKETMKYTLRTISLKLGWGF